MRADALAEGAAPRCPMMPLAMAAPGEEVRLVAFATHAFHGGQRLRKRLADLGLNLGMTVRVLQHDSQGPLLLAVRDSRLAIGRGMALKIMVAPCESGHVTERE